MDIDIELFEEDDGSHTYNLIDSNSPDRSPLIEGFTTMRSALLFLYTLYGDFPEITPKYVEYLRNYQPGKEF